MNSVYSVYIVRGAEYTVYRLECIASAGSRIQWMHSLQKTLFTVHFEHYTVYAPLRAIYCIQRYILHTGHKVDKAEGRGLVVEGQRAKGKGEGACVTECRVYIM